MSTLPPGLTSAGLATLLPQQAQFSAQPQAVRTTNDLSTALLAPVPMPTFAAASGPVAGGYMITVDHGETYQDFLGVGAALTESACYCLLTYMTTAQRQAFLQDAFGAQGFQMVRICIGSADFSARGSSGYYTYDDVANDTALSNFSIGNDTSYVTPILQEVLAINPRVKIIAAPWSPPAWMKSVASLTTGSWPAGSTTNMATYAQYFVKFIQAYQTLGISIWAVTPQNEPLSVNAGYPSCGFAASDEATFIGSYLGPAFDAAGITTKVICGDDQWSSTSYVGDVMSSASALPYIYGAAYHGYGGTPLQEALDLRSYPGKTAHLTEMTTQLPNAASYGTAGGASENTFLSWTNAQAIDFLAGNLAVASTRYGVSSITLWNLLLDPTGAPLAYGTLGARGVCAVSKDGHATITRYPEYYVLAHLGRYVKPGAKRCACNTYGLPGSAAWPATGSDLMAVAFRNPDSSIALFLYNPAGSGSRTVTVTDAVANLSTQVTVAAGDMVSVSWSTAATPLATAGTMPAITPQVPGSVTVAGLPTNGGATLSLSGGVPTSYGTPLQGYNIYDAATAGAEGATPVNGSTPVTLPYTVTGLTNGTAEYFKVAGVNAAGVGQLSAEVSVTPANVPTNPGAGLLVSQDMGAAASAPANGWNLTGFSGSTADQPSVAAHNTVTDPGGGQTASTLSFPALSATANQYSDLVCATSSDPGTGNRTYSLWLRGHAGGEKVSINFTDSSFSTYGAGTTATLTTSWAQYSFTGSLSTGSSKTAIMIVGSNPNNSAAAAAITVDAAWPNVA